MKDNIKELIGSIAFCALVWLMLWAYCKATPNQLSGEADWTEEAIELIEDGERGECAAPAKPVAKKSLQEEVASGALALVGANIKEEGGTVSLMLVFKRN